MEIDLPWLPEVPTYKDRSELERAFEDVLIELSQKTDEQGLLLPNVLPLDAQHRLVTIYQQAEDANAK